MLMSFDGLIEFVRDKMILEFEKTTPENKYIIMNKEYSYFTASDIIKDSIKQDFDLYFTS